jgi:hypothetical protein
MSLINKQLYFFFSETFNLNSQIKSFVTFFSYLRKKRKVISKSKYYRFNHQAKILNKRLNMKDILISGASRGGLERAQSPLDDPQPPTKGVALLKSRLEPPLDVKIKGLGLPATMFFSGDATNCFCF